MLFVSIVMVQDMIPESALRICDVAFAGKKTIWRLIVHTPERGTPGVPEPDAAPEPLMVPHAPESVAGRDEPDVMEDLKLSSESESSDAADSQSLPTDFDDDMASAEQEGMKRSADVVDISEDEDSCSTTLEPQDPDLEAPLKRSRVDELSRKLISAVRLLHRKTKIQVQWMLCRMRPLNFTFRFATINV